METSTMTKAKSFLHSIIAVLVYLTLQSDFVTKQFPIAGPFINAGVAILLAGFVIHWKIKYNTVLGPQGWTNKIILINVVLGILTFIGVMLNIFAQYGITPSESFMALMTEITVFGNMVIHAITVGFEAANSKTDEILEGPADEYPGMRKKALPARKKLVIMDNNDCPINPVD